MDTTAPFGTHHSIDKAVFLLPGVFGDEPQLLRFREHLASRIRFTTLDLPDLESPVSVLCSLPETGRIIVESILRLQQTGDVSIVGFSFGASLALEVAAQLRRAGRTIAYLGLIDGPLHIEDMRRTVRGLVQMLFTPRGPYIISKLIYYKLRFHLDKLRFWKERARSTPADYRLIALGNWQPQRCEARGIVILSIMSFDVLSKNWRDLCPNCRQVKIVSDHRHIIKGSSLYRVASALADDMAGYIGST